MIPKQLTDTPQWILWRSEVRGGKPTKVPCDAAGRPASVTDPAAWHTYDEAVDLISGAKAAGVGFCFTADDPFIGIDLDGCWPALSPAAAEILTKFHDTYQEVSPSGTGVKIFAMGDRGDFTRMRTSEVPGFKQLEVYDRDRFFTVTGQQVGFSNKTVSVQDAVDWLFETYLPNPERKSHAPRADRAPLDASDEEIRDLMFGFANGYAAKLLWEGDMGAYSDDHSAADLALVAYLAFVIGPDPDRIADMFSKSALYRDKWDRADYRDRTIGKVLDDMTDFYSESITRRDEVDLSAILSRSGVEQSVARQAHILEVAGSSPAPATETATAMGGASAGEHQPALASTMAVDAPGVGTAPDPGGTAEGGAGQERTVAPLRAFPIPERGLIREVVDLLGPRSMVPDETIALSMLVMMSAVAGWNRDIKWGESQEPAILFAVIVGKSASGKKTTGMRSVQKLWEDAGVDIGLTAQHTSGRALVEAAIGGIEVFQVKPQKIPADLDPAAQLEIESENAALEQRQREKLDNPPSIVLLWDEFGTMLNVSGRWQEDTRVQLLQMYNGKHSGIRTSGRDGVKVPGGKTSMALLGTMTMDDLCRSLNMGQASDGLLGRILFSPPGRDKPPMPFPPTEDEAYIEARYQVVQAIASFAERVQRRAYSAYDGWTPEAKKLYADWYAVEHERTKEMPLEAALFARGQTIAVKMCALLAAAEDTGWDDDAAGITIVQEHHVSQAIAILEASFGVAMEAVERQVLSQRDRWLDAACTLLESGPMSRWDLSRRPLIAKEPGDRQVSQKEREQWISEDGRLKTEKTNNRGYVVRLATVDDV